MVPPDSTGISRVPAYSGARPLRYLDFAYGTVTLYGPPFQARSTILPFGPVGSHNPATSLDATVWALPRSLAATRGISDLIFLPPGTEMFQFPGLASP